MAALQAPLAFRAPAHSYLETGDDRPGVGQLGVELFLVTKMLDEAATVRAAGGQGGIEFPVDWTDGDWAMTVTAVALTRA